jgi:dual oxidase
MPVIKNTVVLDDNFLSEVLGDPRTNQNPALLAFGILFFRWHNVVAARVQAQHPNWPDEEVFQRTRRTVVATLQVPLVPHV